MKLWSFKKIALCNITTVVKSGRFLFKTLEYNLVQNHRQPISDFRFSTERRIKIFLLKPEICLINLKRESDMKRRQKTQEDKFLCKHVEFDDVVQTTNPTHISAFVCMCGCVYVGMYVCLGCVHVCVCVRERESLGGCMKECCVKVYKVALLNKPYVITDSSPFCLCLSERVCVCVWLVCKIFWLGVLRYMFVISGMLKRINKCDDYM